MKLQVQSSRALHSALQKSMKCISSKPMLSILENALLVKKDNGKFYIVSSTSDAQLTIPAPFSEVDGVFASPVTLPVKILVNFLSTLSDCTVTFEFDKELKNVTLTYCTESKEKVKSGSASFAVGDGNDFPLIQAEDGDDTHIALPMQIFNNIVAKSEKFVGDNDLSPILSCLCLDIASDWSDVVFAASDGHVLMKEVYPNDPQKGGSDFSRGGVPRKILLHKQYFRVLSVFDEAEMIDIKSNGKMIHFLSDDMDFICCHVEGKYPNYNSVIPRDNPYAVCFDKKEFLTTVKRVILFANEATNLITLKKDGLFLDISAKNVDFAKSCDDQVLVSEANCPDGIRIGFNARDLSDTIDAVFSDTIRMQLSDPSKAVVFTADDPSPKGLTLCMPCIVDD